jgi:hypothetical protein
MRLAFFLAFAVEAVAATAPTFHKDVLPILQKNCQSCHRPGEAGPMSFLTYKDTRPWAKAIREAVLMGKMPPWFADPAHGSFQNDRRLSKSDIATLTEWAQGGALEGDPNDAPKPVAFVEGWNIGAPDVVLEMPAEYDVPASGTIEYQHFVVPTHFTEDKWVRVVELRPGNRAVVHHAAVFVRPPKSGWMREAKVGQAFSSQDSENQGLSDEMLDFHVPGSAPHALPPGQAKLIPAGSDLILQMHYTPNGKPAKDRSRLGLIFAKDQPAERVYTLPVINHDFAIPPGAPDYKVDAQMIIQDDTKLVSMNPHMHLRGKAFEFRALYPTGESQVLLRVPNYNFAWQLQYYPTRQLALPKGTRIELSAWFDNSANNPANPNPAKEVRWGDQSWDEMMVGTLDLTLPAAGDPMNLLRPKAVAKAGGPVEGTETSPHEKTARAQSQ